MGDTRGGRTNLKMFSAKSVISIFPLLLVFCDSVSVDKLIHKKCSINDFKCQKKLYRNVMQSISKSGLPEYGIPPIDPFEIKNISVAVLESINIGMEDGVAKGVTKCIFNSVSTDMKKRVFIMDLTCDITIKGKYKVTADSPIIETLLGSRTINAAGFAKIDLEKVRIVSEYDFFLRKGDDGEIYFDYKREGVRYKYEVGKVQLYVDSFLINGEDYSQLIMSLMNNNWEFIMRSFGKPFMDKVMEIFYTFTHKFYEAVPAKDIIIEDMSPYL